MLFVDVVGLAYPLAEGALHHEHVDRFKWVVFAYGCS